MQCLSDIWDDGRCAWPAELRRLARPFSAPRLAADLGDEDYLRAFLEPFGAAPGRAVLWTDRTGMRIPISELMFTGASGWSKLRKRDRHLEMARLAETIMDPDEIWMGVTARAISGHDGRFDLQVDRRYVRLDGDTGMLAVFEMGRRWWREVTAYPPADGRGRPSPGGFDQRRGGKLIWRRNK